MSEVNTENSGYGIDKIMEYLPHRYPFLLVDRVVEVVPNEYIKTYKNVTANESFFQGHFPNQPIMPGVLMIEALAQTSILLIRDSEGMDNEKLYVFTGIDKVRFRKQVIPGDKLEMECTNPRQKLGVWKCEAKAFVDGKLVLQGELTAASVAKK